MVASFRHGLRIYRLLNIARRNGSCNGQSGQPVWPHMFTQTGVLPHGSGTV